MARRLTRAERPRLDAIRLERVSLRLGRHWALREVSFELRAGERWLLSGPNGSGKTVLLKLLRGDVWPTPTGGERRQYHHAGEWHDQPLFARERIAYLGPERQDRYERHGFDLRVAEVVATGLTGDDLLLEPPSAAQWREVRRALRDVGLAGLSDRRFLTLSHGQRRRVLLARALIGRPDVLLLDEVLNGLDAISRICSADDWVLVHDAARPCLPDEMLGKLLDEVADDPVGGLLAVPVADTLKRAAANSESGVRAEATVPRAGLWQAQTPQMFRHGKLVEALRAAGSDMTDEASAIEQLGLQPRLVESDSRNLKVTYPQDLELAGLILGKLNE